jgi:hypothetical protein
MAHEDKKNKKKGYEGPKFAGDTSTYRDEQRKRAEKNAAAGTISNEMFAQQDGAFRDLCEKAGIKPTGRQASKFRNHYGAAARQAGTSTRKAPVSR